YEDNLVVNNFNLEIEDGEFITFLGPSGCGKTTNLRMIAGFIKPLSGEISIGKQVVSNPEKNIFVPPEDRQLGMVFPSYAIWPHMNVFGNIAYPLKIRKVAKNEIIKRVEAMLELVKMRELIYRFPHELSGGQQQRVALARAMIIKPVVLLLDEPLSNLDAKLREDMRIELKELQRETGVTIIFVTHDQMEAMVLSDRIVVMEKGVVHQIDTPENIYQRPSNYFVADFIGVANFINLKNMRDEADQIKSGEKIVVRPEDIEIASKGGKYKAIVKQKLYIGDSFLYVLDFDGTLLKVKTDTSVKRDVGQMVFFTIKQKHLLQRYT
ncbi:MAG: ABC transporter ATP-binding protein, partial [Spirochaetaceae bacterium]|nr:ABC transporter ATP-binding protein [Spirochaetaceae bacterium]